MAKILVVILEKKFRIKVKAILELYLIFSCKNIVLVQFNLFPKSTA